MNGALKIYIVTIIYVKYYSFQWKECETDAGCITDHQKHLVFIELYERYVVNKKYADKTVSSLKDHLKILDCHSIVWTRQNERTWRVDKGKYTPVETA